MFAIVQRRSSSEAGAAQAQRQRPASIRAGSLWSSLALRIDPANSPLEREADAVAARVVGNSGDVSVAPVLNAVAGVQRTCAECEEEEEESKRSIHRQCEAGSSDAGHAASGGEAVASVLKSDPGQPLDSSARGYFEPRFSHSFGDVRVHTGAAAAKSARSDRKSTRLNSSH